MNQPLIERSIASSEVIAAHFDAMAAQVRLNGDASFGGCFVVVPPASAGTPVETLILDREQDPLQFWRLLMEKCKATVEALEAAARTQNSYYGRR